MLQRVEIDNEIDIPVNRKVPLPSTQERFSDPKYSYKPKKGKKWEKQTFDTKNTVTPIGKVSKSSWRFIIKNGTTMERSGMTTLLNSIIPDESKKRKKEAQKMESDEFCVPKSREIMPKCVKPLLPSPQPTDFRALSRQSTQANKTFPSERVRLGSSLKV